MEIKIEVSEERIQEALDRQARVALGHYFQTKEVNKLVTDHVRAIAPELIKESMLSIPDEEIKKMFMEMLKTALEKGYRVV